MSDPHRQRRVEQPQAEPGRRRRSRCSSRASCRAPAAQVDPQASWRARSTAELAEADAVAHRIVHGGERFRDAVAIDDAVVRELRELTDLAPLHQPKSLAALDAVCGTAAAAARGGLL